MFYACVEDGTLISVMSYPPTVPSTVRVIPITDQDHELLTQGDHYFDTVSGQVLARPDQHRQEVIQQETQRRDRAFLRDTDWKVLRHLRERALGIETSLTHEQYLALEQQRHTRAKNL